MRPGYLRDLKTGFKPLHISVLYCQSQTPRKACMAPPFWAVPWGRDTGVTRSRREDPAEKRVGLGCSLTYWDRTGTGSPEGCLKNLRVEGTPSLVHATFCVHSPLWPQGPGCPCTNPSSTLSGMRSWGRPFLCTTAFACQVGVIQCALCWVRSFSRD